MSKRPRIHWGDDTTHTHSLDEKRKIKTQMLAWRKQEKAILHKVQKNSNYSVAANTHMVTGVSLGITVA